MRVLGIESSCDETAAAVVSDGESVLSSVVASQVPTHARYGGVVPELASREHLRKIVPVVEEACRRAAVRLDEVDAIAVTEGPGLIGSLLVGVVYGKAVALGLGKPLVGVNHLEGHIHAVLLESKLAETRRDKPAGRQAEILETLFPNITLVVSGGHTTLFRVERGEDSPEAPRFRYTRLGQTRDDAAGEAFDKVAKLLGLGYPGGPIIDRLAATGNPRAVEFGRIRIKGNALDFSFSGLKTAVLYRVRGTALETEAAERRSWRSARLNEPGAPPVAAEDVRAHCSQTTLDLVASFQNAVSTDLVERTLAAASEDSGTTPVRSIFVSGGVACNSLLRERFARAGRRRGFPVLFPTPALSTDNAAMIAAAGYYRLAAGERAGLSLTGHASLPLGAQATTLAGQIR